ncbi:SDR family oxidoreductase, partial [Magnetococcales bacterium HHB-1]
SGGIGAQLTHRLSERFHILALYNQTALDDELQNQKRVTPIPVDLSQPDWPEMIKAGIPERGLYGIIHSAWPSMVRGGLLNQSGNTLQKQLDFGVLQLVELARLMTEHPTESGARLITIGSVAGGYRPSLNVAPYSLGKMAQEQTVRLLAAELASKGITVNAVNPNFLPIGMNKEANARRVKLEEARIPQGRLCSPGDIENTILWLLSEGASYVSGQLIGLAGAQL